MANEIKIINPWRGEKSAPHYYYFSASDLIYTKGEYRIFKQFDKAYIYTKGNIAINCLAGINKPHVDSLHANKRLVTESAGFLYDRARENYETGLLLTNQ